MVTEATKVSAATAIVTISDADSIEVDASELSAIGNSTTGAVTATGALAIDGTHAELTAALVTEGTKVVAGKTGTTATVSNALTAATAASLAGVNNVTAIFSAGVTDEISNLTTGNAVHANVTTFTTEDSDAAITIDDGSGTFDARKLSALGNSTTGAVTVSNALTITGDHDQVTAALVTEATKVTAATAVVTISDANTVTMTAAELSAIGNLTTGAVTVSNAVTITGDHDQDTACVL